MTFLAVLVLAVGLSLMLSPFMAHHGSTGLDQRVLDWFATRRTDGWNHVMWRISWVGSSVVIAPVTVAATIGLLAARRLRVAFFLVVTVAGAAWLNALAKDAVGRSRPPAAGWLQHADASSFPSGHSTAAAATYVALGIVVALLTRSPVLRAVAWTLLGAIVLAVGISRVYLGVHWATDVVAGWLVGTTWAVGVANAVGLVRPHGAVSRRRAGTPPSS
ncbi:MAG: phosphatase PAP2 family protein [Acidimicrobiia bacterium]